MRTTVLAAVTALAVPVPLTSAGTAQAEVRDGWSVRICELNSHGTPYSKVRRTFG
ncbi:hypothetical protein SAMN04488074_103439 [Lentzea albidocapillata subsp. violacea]|uniref:Uncharacterized protein n=1 Tax=Lentzea albidocapillata subsp. violacea TaxID=128104 RepID=A0A1G8XE87_9PSEU|nr:hypothetical protein [Lentzea albidocapillata]SDJ88255.1 hypothetical protein SAMN04488074_103439 [Lentzea albidocapillata subsp. violacea]